MIDSLHRKKFDVIIALDNKKDTLEVKSDRNDNYTLDYELEGDSQLATLQMLTENKKRFSRTIVVDEDILDLQFFPESGELINGLQSKVGFKALDANGKGKMVEGEIIDENDDVLSTFKSNELGMGTFMLLKPDTVNHYYARLKSKMDDDKVMIYPLPKVAARGNQLTVEQRGDNILLAAQSNYIKNDIVSVNVSFRGMILYDMKVTLHDGISSVLIPREKLPEGIISFTMKDDASQPVAARLYFNEKPESRINLSVSTDKNAYAKREKTDLDIKATDAKGDPIAANLSVLVINKKQLGKFQSTRQNILSYFLLESELKGEIEDPGYYFSSENSRQNDLDALMLTQGWRKYNYSKKYKELTYVPERRLSVTGEVSGVVSEKKKKVANLILMTFDKENQTAYSEKSDSTGYFRFNLYDEYGDDIQALIQSSKLSGKKVDYNINLDKKRTPPIHFTHVKSVEKLDSVSKVLVEKNIERQKVEEAFPLDSGNILLQQVDVQGYKLTPERKKLVEKYGMPTTIIGGKQLKEEEADWSWGVTSVLMFNHAELFRFREPDSSAPYISSAAVYGTDMTLLAIDGEIVDYRDLNLGINFIPINEIISVEVIKNAKNFAQAFWECYHTFPGPEILSGSIISIYTRSGKGIYASQTRGMTYIDIQGFSKPIEFYSPKYANIKQDEMQRPDLRALVKWSPEVQTDSLGKASVSYYNADNIGDMTVVVEAVSEYGEIGYKEIDYPVEGTEEKHIFD